MTMPMRRSASQEDIAALPENLVGEIVDGELFASPRPTPRHAVSTSALAGALVAPLQFGEGGPGGWWFLFEPELHLNEQVVVPDLAGWRRERLPTIPEEPYFSIAPDWLCEVLSPSTHRFDRTKKLPTYARAAVQNLWLIDPIAETLEVYRLDTGRWLLLATHGGDDVVTAEPFEGVRLDLKRVWAR